MGENGKERPHHERNRMRHELRPPFRSRRGQRPRGELALDRPEFTAESAEVGLRPAVRFAPMLGEMS